MNKRQATNTLLLPPIVQHKLPLAVATNNNIENKNLTHKFRKVYLSSDLALAASY
jgi:hypothetical protein